MSVYRQGEKCECSDYRGISNLSGRVGKERVVACTKHQTADEQCGFSNRDV